MSIFSEIIYIYYEVKCLNIYHEFMISHLRKKNAFPEVHLFWRLINRSYPIYAISQIIFSVNAFEMIRLYKAKTPLVTQYIIMLLTFLSVSLTILLASLILWLCYNKTPLAN